MGRPAGDALRVSPMLISKVDHKLGPMLYQTKLSTMLKDCLGLKLEPTFIFILTPSIHIHLAQVWSIESGEREEISCLVLKTRPHRWSTSASFILWPVLTMVKVDLKAIFLPMADA
jgi:hypothetical protein